LVVENINDLAVHEMCNIELISFSFLESQLILAFCPSIVTVRKFACIFSVDCFVCPVVVNLVSKLTAMQDIVLWLDEVVPGI
jgi:hypothetical protein